MLPSHRGLFVIGVARSGTTVLQNALNDSGDIYLLGEPDLHIDGDAAGFAGRFNAMHRKWGNQHSKSSWMPCLIDEDGGWRTHLDQLAAHYRWVGTKIVVNPGHAPEWMEQLEHFQARYFYDARYLFVFRHPEAVVRSYRGMQEAAGDKPGDPAPTLANYVETIALFTRMVRTFPNVLGLIHEDIGESTFQFVGEWLGADLSASAQYYDTARIRFYEERSPSGDEYILQLTRLYEDLRVLVRGPVRLPQIEQNDGHLDPSHFTAIGSIDRRARFLKDCFVTS